MPSNFDSFDNILFERHPDPMVLVNQNGLCLKMNASFVAHYNVTVDQTLQANIVDVLGWENWDGVWHGFLHSLNSQEVFIRDKTGNRLTVQVSSIPVAEKGSRAAAYLIIRNITEQKLLEEYYREKNEILHWIETNSSDFITVIDNQGIVRYASPSYTNIFGRPHTEILNRHALEYVHPDDVPFLQERLAESFAGQIYWHPVEFRYLHVDGHWVYTDIRATPIETQDGAGKIILFARDISMRKQQEQLIQHMAYHDPLTGLPNRSFLFERLGQILKRETETIGFGLLFIDLDGFKVVNDTQGHAAGDCLLQMVTERLQRVLPKNGFFARMGGDEFVILLDHLSCHDDARKFAQLVLGLIAEPFSINDIAVCLTTSIGISLYPLHGSSVEDLILIADAALYKAKNMGKNTYYFLEQ